MEPPLQKLFKSTACSASHWRAGSRRFKQVSMPVPDPAEGKKWYGAWGSYGQKHCRSMCRCLKDKHYAKILKYPSFRGLQEVSKAKMQTAEEKGMGSGPRTASALTTKKDESFWKSGVFTPAPSLGVLKIMFFYMSMNFGMRSGHYVCCVVICRYVVL